MIACMAAAGRTARLWIDAQERLLGRMHGLWARWDAARRWPPSGYGPGRRARGVFRAETAGIPAGGAALDQRPARGDVDLIGWDETGSALWR